MVSFADIENLAAQIAREFRPEKIILFGSHARGAPSPDSDVDLLVIMPFDGKPFWARPQKSSRRRHHVLADRPGRRPPTTSVAECGFDFESCLTLANNRRAGRVALKIAIRPAGRAGDEAGQHDAEK